VELKLAKELFTMINGFLKLPNLIAITTTKSLKPLLLIASISLSALLEWPPAAILSPEALLPTLLNSIGLLEQLDSPISIAQKLIFSGITL
jgi:hypothetical protein